MTTPVRSAQGEDRSSFQPVSSWAGLDFGFAKATEGLTWSDPTFPGNWANLRAEGKPRGAYHFLHPGQDPKAQAGRFIRLVKSHGLHPGDMLACDSELMSGVRESSPRSATGIHLGMQSSWLSATLVDGATRAFLDECARLVDHAVHPLVTYTMESVGQNLHATARAHPLLWFAHPSATAPTAAQIAPFRHWKFWQWGQVAGVDKDAFDGTKPHLATWLEGYTSKGPYRHVADGAKSLEDLAAARGTDAAHLLTVTAAAYTPADIAVAAGLKLPAGAPYYTANP